MKVLRLKNIRKRYFNLQDLARVLNISADSSRVTASRYSADLDFWKIKSVNDDRLLEKLKTIFSKQIKSLPIKPQPNSCASCPCLRAPDCGNGTR